MVSSCANLPGIDSVTASCDLGALRVVMPIERPPSGKIPLKQPAS